MKQNNCVGKIHISEFILEAGNIPEAFHAIEFTVIKCEHLFHQKIFEYYGYSPQFKEIEDCEEIPKYDLFYHGDNTYKIEKE